MEKLTKEMGSGWNDPRRFASTFKFEQRVVEMMFGIRVSFNEIRMRANDDELYGRSSSALSTCD